MNKKLDIWQLPWRVQTFYSTRALSNSILKCLFCAFNIKNFAHKFRQILNSIRWCLIEILNICGKIECTKKNKCWKCQDLFCDRIILQKEGKSSVALLGFFGFLPFFFSTLTLLFLLHSTPPPLLLFLNFKVTMIFMFLQHPWIGEGTMRLH